MPKRAKGLTANFVATVKELGRYADGDNLYLSVKSETAKYWAFRFSDHGKRPEMSLGPAVGPGAVKLAQARAKTRELNAMRREDRNPLAERRAAKAKKAADKEEAKAKAVTFGQAGSMYLDAHETSWRSPKHRQQWRSTLRDHCAPIRDTPVNDVDTAAVMKVVMPLWRTKVETGSRTRGRIEAVLDFARVQGWRREGANPAAWRGHLDHILPKRSKVQRIKHYAALDWREIGAFLARLRRMTSISAKCLEFTILTACRSGEARGARWSEIDIERAMWTIPAERTKATREHRVPLSDPTMAVLREVAQFGSHPTDLVFPGSRSGSTMSDVVLARAVKAAVGEGATVHGFRACFRTWAGEMTAFPREVIEMALAHRLGDAAEQAYARGDLLERRRRLMADWAAFCGRPMIGGEVVPLHAAR